MGTIFRDLDLPGADFAGAAARRTQWLRCALEVAKAVPRDPLQALIAPRAAEPRPRGAAPAPHQPLGLPPFAAQAATFTGHAGPVNSAAFSPDGRLLVSASGNGTVRLWDIATSRERGPRLHHPPRHRTAALAPDGSAILHASPGAWRWLGWLAPNPATGEITRLPAETFGPLPGP